ncbi:MAG: hypothetical protein V7678_11105 [Brevundimonas sp.]
MPDPIDPEQSHRDDELDQELEDSFPASDPPSITQPHDPDGEDEDEDED